ncbi:MAG: DUF1987 domain-containing protein [Cryomorphaceae bacterium]|nr:MAG: DUF1987 domain-containing protein [Cryomorphaceae bacterium]
MENITLEGSTKTPSVQFDATKGSLAIRGRSIPENSIEFYSPLLDWIDTYGTNAKNPTVVIIQLEYFNTSSSKCILDIFKRLEKIRSQGNEVLVKWHYEADDEDMLEAGEDYQAIISLPFEMIEVEEA